MNTKNNRKVDGRGDAVNIIVQTGRSLPLACTYTHTYVKETTIITEMIKLYCFFDIL